MEGKILVTTEVLRSTASEFQGAMTQIQNYTSMMVEETNGLSAKFQGDAATTYINKFNQLQDDIAKVADLVNKHVTELNEMADNYEASQGRNIDKAEALSGDVLV